jgi:hypothetical protein
VRAVLQIVIAALVFSILVEIPVDAPKASRRNSPPQTGLVAPLAAGALIRRTLAGRAKDDCLERNKCTVPGKFGLVPPCITGFHVLGHYRARIPGAGRSVVASALGLTYG